MNSRPMTRNHDLTPEHDLARAASQKLPRAGKALQKLLGVGFEGNRPARERAALWCELAAVARELAELSERFEQQAARLDYIEHDDSDQERHKAIAALPAASDEVFRRDR